MKDATRTHEHASENARKRASVHALGCRLNQSEIGLLVELLERAGYDLVPFGEPADLGIINTCTVTREADAKCRQLIRSFIRKNPEAFTAVIGCYSQLGHKALAEIEGIDLILGNQGKLDVLEYVHAGKNETPVIVRGRILRDDFVQEIVGDGPLTRRVNLKIQDGCNFMCSFCVIPFARGRERSRQLANLLEEAEQLVVRGVKEIILTGVNVGRYAHAGNTIVEVVDHLNDIAGLERVRISSIEPTTIPEALFDAMDDGAHALVPYLHIPVQSGSNRVLASMKRKHTAEEFVAFIEQAHRRVRDLCVGTDILVGAPGETDDDFDATARLLEESPIAYAHVFKYSERRNTAASHNPDKVDPKVLTRRSARIRRISARKLRAFHESFLGRTLDVLFEQQDSGFWFGYTGNYIRVAAPSPDDLTNVIRPVTLDRVSGDIVQGTVSDTTN